MGRDGVYAEAWILWRSIADMQNDRGYVMISIRW